MTTLKKIPGIGIPPVPGNTTYIKAGAITIGVEHRLLDFDIALAVEDAGGVGDPNRRATLERLKKEGRIIDDRGVSLHIFDNADGKLVEHLRFDCFDRDPHYHYIFPSEKKNDRHYFKDVTSDSPLTWALEQLKENIPALLTEADAPRLAIKVDQHEVQAIFPEIIKAVEVAERKLSADRRKEKAKVEETPMVRKASG